MPAEPRPERAPRQPGETTMKSRVTLLLLLLVGYPSLGPAAEPASLAGAKSMFDGKTLEGWEGNREAFRVVDGAIVGGTLEKKIPRNEFLCTTKEYGDFELRLKFKVLGEGVNAGVQFRTKRIPDHHEVIGYQADIGQKYWGSLYDESRRKKILAQADLDAVMKVVKQNDWNEYVIRAVGPRIQFWLNGMPTIDYTEPDDTIARRGVIAVQIHGGPPSEAWYKDISITELD
jgi:hypothetical protein